MFIFTHPSTPETTHVYVDNSHVDLWSANAKTFVYNFFKVLRRDKKQSHQPTIHCWPTKLVKHDRFLKPMVIRNQLFQSFRGGRSIFHFNKRSFAWKKSPNVARKSQSCIHLWLLKVWVLSKFDQTLTFKSLSFIKVWLLKVWVLSKFDFWKSEFYQSLTFESLSFVKVWFIKSEFCQSLIFVPKFDKTQTFKSQTLIKLRLLKVKLW